MHKFIDERYRVARLVGDQTTVKNIRSEDLSLFRYMAREAILNQGTLWRHNGQGMLQAYIYEGSGYEARVHIWHESLRKDGIFDNGLVHEHRFDMRSFVILGGITHEEMSLEDVHTHVSRPYSTSILEVTHARKAKTEGGKDYHMDPRPLDGNVRLHSSKFSISNQVYNFPRFRYHKAYTEHPTTVSIVLKSRQVDINARLIDQRSQGSLVNSFENTLQRPEFQNILDDTATLLGNV